MIDLKHCRVLLVDDSKTGIDVLRNCLDSEYVFDSVTNGEDALKHIESNPTDLILLDIVMPGMDGYEVCRSLKDDEFKGLELGAVDYITKPFSKPIVRARVRNHLMMKKQRDLLENLSNIDGLTGIPNRRSFERRLNVEWRQGLRLEMPLSLIMIDIDLFKSFNDRYGHAAGDECLRHVAQELESSLKRPRDSIFRYGGEEFVGLLPETPILGALAVAENIGENIASLRIPYRDSPVASHVTVSQGVATLVPQDADAPIRLIEAADRALYEAKQEGRNRLMSYEL
jgi:diguanylate cyclase (GGDEF)-like protein